MFLLFKELQLFQINCLFVYCAERPLWYSVRLCVCVNAAFNRGREGPAVCGFTSRVILKAGSCDKSSSSGEKNNLCTH